MLTEAKVVTVGKVEMNWNGVSIGSELITFTPDHNSGYKAWLIRHMHDILVRWGAIKSRQIGDQMTYRQVVINYKDLSKYLWEHTASLEALLYQEIDYIVLGHDAMSILQLEWINKPYSFTLPEDVPFDIYKGTYHWSLAGYRIRCLPWFYGVLVVPKDSAKL
jgi:hypothetical protein